MDAAGAYERSAHAFMGARDRSSIGSQVVDRWARTLRRGATVIDVGCGGGYPVTRVLDAAGLHLWAVDSSPTLVAEFRLRFPNTPVQCARVQESDFFGRSYDGAVAVGLLFLLSASDQAALISRVAGILVPNGRFLFTAPILSGHWSDTVTGLECSSLGRERYGALLSDAGLRVIATYSDEGGNHHYDVEKTG